jgi:hypothetical protein
MTRATRLWLCVAACLMLLSTLSLSQSIATAELHVSVKDPNGAAVTNATVTVRDPARNIERTLQKSSEGQYQFLLLPPGVYTVTIEAPGFAKTVAQNVKVTVGQSADLPVTLPVAGQTSEVTVSAQADIVETQRTSESTTIDQTSIDNLPINGRNYINFTLMNSQTTRDNAPSIGAAPTSGLNIGGQRARANLVNVDGVNFIDNSVNGVRSTVSQDAVQEFQLITNSYAAEYGQASGGVVNIISKSGTNQLHGSAYGYLRNRDFQAVNPFSNVPNPAYTRVQAGFTLGGALKKDKTFYFLSYETTRRQETGFSTVGQDGYGLIPFDASPFLQAPPNTFMIQATPGQAAFFANPAVQALAAQSPAYAQELAQYAILIGASSGIAINGSYPQAYQLLALNPQTAPFVANGLKQFPTSCNGGASQVCLGLPASFAPLLTQTGNYPISEGTSLIGLRLDQKISSTNSAMFHVAVSPSTMTGLQVQGQDQNFGQNAFSRTAIQQYRDVSFTAQDTASIGNNKINEFRFQYARRGLLFNYNNASPDGANVASNIVGFAFTGREPYSYIRREEQRYQFADNFSWSAGTHNIKFGTDINRLPVSADFTVNFGGVYDFAGLDALGLGFVSPNVPNVPSFPGFNAVQAYGLGIPQTFIQGVGNPHDAFSITPLGFFLQDSWRIRPNLTLNYGVRYDVELVPQAPPLNTISQAGYNVLGLTNGIPQDNNNVAPRIGLAWDPFKNGKTVIRASYGIFYDHPLLGLEFLAQATDGVGTPQIVLPGAAPCGTPGATPLSASNTFQGILQSPSCMGPAVAGAFGYDSTQQRFIPNAPNSLWVNQNFLAAGVPLGFLPFGFPLTNNFQYAYSNQADLTIERDLGKGFALSVGYDFNGGRHLNRPINANTVVTSYLVNNWTTAQAAALAAGLTPPSPGNPGSPNWPSSPFAVGVENPAYPMYNPCGMAGNQAYVPAPLVNYFRPSGLNPTMTGAFGPCTAFAAGVLDQLFPALVNGMPAGAPMGVPFSDMNANYSNGSSDYNGLTANLRKRLSQHYEFLASYTYSHAIDDSTDLQSPLAPQDSYYPAAERANSTFDQRHRFVFSGVYQSGKVSGQSFTSRFLSDWTLAPIIEFGSGRPFNVGTGDQTNFQFAPLTARPNVVSANAPVNACGAPVVNSPYLSGVYFQEPCALSGNGDGNLGRNAFTKPGVVFTDMRVAREIHFTERVTLEGIVDVFNFINKFNVQDVNPLCSSSLCIAGQPTAAYDPRQFQFALRLMW